MYMRMNGATKSISSEFEGPEAYNQILGNASIKDECENDVGQRKFRCRAAPGIWSLEEEGVISRIIAAEGLSKMSTDQKRPCLMVCR